MYDALYHLRGSTHLLYCIAQLAEAVEYRLLLCSGGKIPLPLNVFPGYDTKQSDGEVPVILELWGMGNTSSSSLLLGSL